VGASHNGETTIPCSSGENLPADARRCLGGGDLVGVGGDALGGLRFDRDSRVDAPDVLVWWEPVGGFGGGADRYQPGRVVSDSFPLLGGPYPGAGLPRLG